MLFIDEYAEISQDAWVVLCSKPPTKTIFDDEKRIAAYLGLKMRVKRNHKGLLQLRSATNLRKTISLEDMRAYCGMVERRQR